MIPYFAFDPAIRKIIYTTIAIERLSRIIRRSLKAQGSFPTHDAATKLIYLTIWNFEKDGWNRRMACEVDEQQADLGFWSVFSVPAQGAGLCMAP